MFEDKLRGWSFILQSQHAKIIKHHSLNLRPANILISPLPESTLGLWHRDARTIEISLKLVENHSWKDVEFTLRHEMAHQIVDEIFAVKEKPHGKSFAKACSLLGISSAATVKKHTVQKSSVQSKIAKLLALSSSSNENESAAALAKAHELSCKYNIELIDQGQLEYTILPVGDIRKRIPRFEHTIIAILTEFYFVKALQNYRLNAAGQNAGWQFEVYGSQENLSIAEYVYNYLINQGQELWEKYRRVNGAVVNRKKRTYLSGLYDGFYKKLRHERELILNKFSLVKTSDEKLDNFYAEMNPSVVRRSFRQSVDPNVYNDGVAQGKEMRIHHGLGKKSSGKMAGLIEG